MKTSGRREYGEARFGMGTARANGAEAGSGRWAQARVRGGSSSRAWRARRAAAPETIATEWLEGGRESEG